MMIVGINPAWRVTETLDAEIRQSRNLHESLDFDAYRRWRAAYFEESSKAYYGRYFTRLGNALTRAFDIPVLGNGSRSARQVFREYAAKFDLLPWWSSNVHGMHLDKAAGLTPVRAWKAVLDAFRQEKQPTAIVINASGQRTLVEQLFDVSLQRHCDSSFHAGRSDSDGAHIIVHPQLNHARGLGHDIYDRTIKAITR